MFWDKAYTPSPNIEALLQKEDLKVEELLDDEDILQECKTQKRSLIQYLTRPDIIKRLIELIIAEPPEDLPTAQRFKYANMACEVLTIGLPSLDEKLVDNPDILQTLYSFLEQEPPLNPLLSSFFSKTFNMLISKKSEQDWFLYQKMCLQVLEFLKSRGNFLDLIYKHFATPVVMDLLLQMIREVQGGQLKKNLYEWLNEQQLIERLINMLGESEQSDKHNNISEFLSELIRNGRSMRQREQDNDSFEPAFIGNDPLLQCIEDEKTIALLLDVILKYKKENLGQKNSSITAGINIVLTLVDESIVDEPASDKALKMIIDKEKENHEKIVSTVIRVITPRIKEFHDILLVEPEEFSHYFPNFNYTTFEANVFSPPFGQTRLQICRLFTVLLRTGNEDIIDKICETKLFVTLLKLFKHYTWNNFLHSEVEKCFEYIFATTSTVTALDTTITTFNNNDDSNNDNDHDDNDKKDFGSNKPSALQHFVIVNCKIISKLIDCWMYNKNIQSKSKGHRLGFMGHLIKIFQHITTCISNSDHIGALIESNLNQNNSTTNDNENDYDGNDELKIWKLITDKENGELVKELNLQNKLLADCDPNETYDCNNMQLPKEFNNENLCSNIEADYEMEYGIEKQVKNNNRRRTNYYTNDEMENESLSLSREFFNNEFEKFVTSLPDCMGDGNGGGDGNSSNNGLGVIGSGNGNNNGDQQNQQQQHHQQNSSSSDKLVDYMVLNLQRDLRVWGGGLYNNDDDDEDTEPLNITINPWGTDPFGGSGNTNNTNVNCNDIESGSGWADFSNNFADFDTHFNSFISDLGTSYDDNTMTAASIAPATLTTTNTFSESTNNENNSNVSSSQQKNPFNSFEIKNEGVVDDDDDNFELSYKNAKNLNILKGTSSDREGNENDDEKNNEIKSDDIEKEKHEKDQIIMTKKENIESNLNADTKYQNSYDDDVVDNDMKFEEADLSKIRNDNHDTQQIVNNSTNLNDEIINNAINEDNSNIEHQLEKDEEKEMQSKQQPQNLSVISTSNGPIENDDHENRSEIQNKESLTEQEYSINNENTIVLEKNDNKKDNENVQEEQSLTERKISLEDMKENSNNDNSMIVNDDLQKNVSNIINVETTAAALTDAVTTSTTTTAAAVSNVIPLEKQENGPV